MRAGWIVPAAAAALLLLGAPRAEAAIPFVAAKHYRPGRPGRVRLLVLHSTEGGTARTVAAMFARGDAVTSAHYVIDATETIACVREADTAFAAPGANDEGIQIEACGWARWSAAEWAASRVVPRVAALVRAVAARHAIPLVYVDAAGLRARRSGITTHAAVASAFGLSTHSDPGSGFPMGAVL